MKNTTYWFSIIVIANILFIKFYSSLDIYRVIAFIALLLLVYAIPNFSTSFAQLFSNRDLHNKDTHAENPPIVKSVSNKSIFITASVLLMLLAFHILGYYAYFKSEKDNLSRSGIYAGAVVTHKRLESRSDNLYKYYIYYSYKYNGKIYFHNCQNNSIEVGDTIIVKFSPENPDHHIIMEKIF